MIPFLVLLGVLAAIVLGVEGLSRVAHLPLELTRKATHILTGVAVAVGAAFVGRDYLIVLSLLFILVIILSRSLGIFRSIHDAERHGFGELWYPLGILLAAVLFSEPRVFAYAILILAVSDGLAGLVGKFYGKRRVGFISAPKTYLGAGTFIVSAFVLSLLIMPLPVALGAAVYLAIVELLSFRGLDNLILPLAAGVIATVFA